MKKLIKWFLIIAFTSLTISLLTTKEADNSQLFRDGKIMYTSTNLNVRSKPSQDSKKIKTLKPNSPVLTTSKDVTGWTLIGDVDSNKIGYVSAKYLSNNTNKIVKVDIEKELKVFEQLYNELLSFKSSDDFAEYGFGQGGNYYQWLERVNKLENNPKAKLLSKNKGLLAGELLQLGLEYTKTKGDENEITLFFNKAFEKSLYTSKEPNDRVTKVVQSNADILISKWVPEAPYNTLTLSVELYQTKNDNHYLKNSFSDGTQSIKSLSIVEKNRQTIYEYDNNHGEYYILNPNGNITLHDDFGEGYVCILVK